MKNVVMSLSFAPIVIAFVLLAYLIIGKMINLKTLAFVGLMMLSGAAFVIFMKYLFDWNSVVTLSDVISSSLGLVIMIILLVILPAIKDGQFSISNILPGIKSLNFLTIALLIYFGLINLILFTANLAKYVR